MDLLALFINAISQLLVLLVLVSVILYLALRSGRPTPEHAPRAAKRARSPGSFSSLPWRPRNRCSRRMRSKVFLTSVLKLEV